MSCCRWPECYFRQEATNLTKSISTWAGFKIWNCQYLTRLSNWNFTARISAHSSISVSSLPYSNCFSGNCWQGCHFHWVIVPLSAIWTLEWQNSTLHELLRLCLWAGMEKLSNWLYKHWSTWRARDLGVCSTMSSWQVRHFSRLSENHCKMHLANHRASWS